MSKIASLAAHSSWIVVILLGLDTNNATAQQGGIGQPANRGEKKEGVPLNPAGWRLATNLGAQAELIQDPSRPGVMQVRIASVGTQPEQIRLCWDSLEIREGQKVEVRLRARAQWNRPIVARLIESDGAASPLTDDQPISLQADWGEFRVSFSPSRTTTNARFCLDAGDRPGSVEVSDIFVSGASVTNGKRTGEVQPNGEAPANQQQKQPSPADPSASSERSAGYRIDVHEGAQAQAKVDEQGRLRIDFKNPGTKAWHVQLSIPGFSIEKGQQYTLVAKLGAEAERPAAIAVSLDEAPWTGMGLYQQVTLTPEAKELRLKFQGGADGKVSRVNIDLGRSSVAVFLASLAIEKEGGQATTLWPQASASPAKETRAEAQPKSDVPAKPNADKSAPLNSPQQNAPQPNTPAAAGAPEKGKSWELSLNGDAKAQLQLAPDARGRWKVAIDNPGSELWNVQVNRRGLNVAKGKKGKVSFRAKADKAREIAVALSLGKAPWTNLGLYQKVAIETEQRPFHFEFLTTEQAAEARLHFDIGGAAPAVEIEDVQLQVDGVNVDLAAAPSTGNQLQPSSRVAASPTWDFQVQGVPARCTIVSTQPWHLRVTVGAAGSADSVRLLRTWPTQGGLKLKAAPGAKVKCRLMDGEKAAGETEVTSNGEWQPIKFNGPAQGMAVFELGSQSGPIEIAEEASP